MGRLRRPTPAHPTLKPVLILVTGSTGFLGSHLCRALLAAGHTVRALHRATSALEALDGLPVERVAGDILDPASTAAALEGVDVVFHAAAEMGPVRRVERMMASHILGTRNVAQAALQAGVERLVHVSSVAALGMPDRPGEDAPLLAEDHPWNVSPRVWPYGFAKHRAEMEVLDAVARGLDAVIVNPALVIGPGDIHRVRSSLMWQVARGRVPAAVRGGLNVVHVDDVIEGCLAALERGRCGERYLLAGQNLPIVDILAQAAQAAGRQPPRLILPTSLVRRLAPTLEAIARFLAIPFSAGLLRFAGYSFYYDRTKSRSELCLPEPRPFRQAAEAALAWYRARGLLPA